MIHHRGTERTEEAQRIKPLCYLCVLSDSVVSLIQAPLNRKPLWFSPRSCDESSLFLAERDGALESRPDGL
jgi:hypothetical protein